jgi:cation transport regulator ChaC
MTLRLRRQLHPNLRHHLSLIIGRRSLLQIVGIYLVATLASSVIRGVLSSAVSHRREPVSSAIRNVLSNLINPGDLLETQNEGVAFYVVAAVAGFLGVVLPVFLLGAFVYKLFQFDPITWRRKISVETTWRNSKPVMTIRFYNNSRSALLDNEIQVVARVRSAGRPQVITNLRMNLVREGVELDSIVWPYARPGVPFTIYVPLGEGISALEVGHGEKICIPGYAEALDKSRVAFFVLVRGVVQDNGGSYLSARIFPAGGIAHGHFQEIDADYEAKPRTWPGWDRFDENNEMYVFGYGSLVSPASVEKTLGHNVPAASVVPAELVGWRRAWNVGSDRASHPERTFFLRNDDGGRGAIFKGITVVLGIERVTSDDGTTCNGAVFPVFRGDLNLLDVRERNYERIDVTDSVKWDDKPPNCTVYTYVPKAEAAAKVALARNHGLAMNVRSEYKAMVEAAFASVGEEALRRYRETTPEPADDMPVESMETVIDEGTAVPIAQAAMASYFADIEPAELEREDVATTADDTIIPRQAEDGTIEVTEDRGEVEGADEA